MYENSAAREIAWQEANKLFPTDYDYEAGSKDRVGYPIYRSTVKDVNAWISDLNCRLEVNVEQKDHSITSTNVWVDYDWTEDDANSSFMSREEYSKLWGEKNEFWYDWQFKAWVHEQFGFEENLIEIQHDIAYKAVNKRTGEHRAYAWGSRSPEYNSPEWNYCRFKVCDYMYEVVNGVLHMLEH
ncbi:MAG: hypothetical protein LUE27_06920 [Clostridia bacterium]|nr:hypothetical protein [Clostridia bacterium]